MNANNRFCTYIGHDQYAATHLCIFKDCKLQQRWCCIQCITQGVHNHNQQGFSHLIPWKDVMVQKKEELLKIQQDHQNRQLQCLQQCLQQCIQLIKFIKDYQSFIEQQINKIQIAKEGIQDLISDLNEYNFIQLDKNRLDEVITMNQSKLLKDQVLQIKSYLSIQQKLKSIIKELYQGIPFTQTIDLKQVKYQIKQIDQFDSLDQQTSQISNNSKYLAYNKRQLLKIHDIQKDSIVREIILDDYISVIQFTLDSSQLYVGCNNGYVLGFDVLNDFKQIFNLLIHQEGVTNIRTIQNIYLITCSVDETIIKTDIATKQQIFKLIGHSNYILAIDYNEIDDVLISGSSDRSIKLWDCKNKSILINQEKSHPSTVNQIQLINNFENVLSLDFKNNLYKWRIDLRQKLLIKIQEFQDPYGIFSFYQINQNQNLILISGLYIKILNNQADTINQIDHQAGDFNSKFLNNMKNGQCMQNVGKFMTENQFKQDLVIKLCWLQPIIDRHEQKMKYEQISQYINNLIKYGFPTLYILQMLFVFIIEKFNHTLKD